MPKTEAELYDRIIDINRRACHHRGLGTSYGYRAILDVNLGMACLALRERFPPPIRVLDVGCGDGFAMEQLSKNLWRMGGRPEEFELWGMGMNRYEEMSLPPERFIESGLNAYQSDGRQFHLIVSVFTFHYMWHKLEGVEKIHNELLAQDGEAYLHFPGYLVRVGESPAALSQDEETGNRVFQDLLARHLARGDVGPMRYRLVPYHSDDDDCSLLAEFGNLHFRKTRAEPIRFRHRLMAFALFTQGFHFARMNNSPLTYVASHYSPENRAVRKAIPGAPRAHPHPYRITALPSEANGRQYQIDIAVHTADTDTIVVLCPGACEPLAGTVTAYEQVADHILCAGLGAVIRYADPYDHAGQYQELVLENFRRVLAFAREHAAGICATHSPRILVMAYSSGAGAAAALAADYAVDALLLVAPSFDVPRPILEPGFRRFTGDVRILIGDSDGIVLPQQAFWFYEQAAGARSREYVEVPCCSHNFGGPTNQAVFRDAPLWAFTGDRPAGFPPPRTEPSVPEE
jgi:SAM-dependent methyltransferase